jgi:16S rRNA (guanine527-N7)-methyltransferase
LKPALDGLVDEIRADLVRLGFQDGSGPDPSRLAAYLSLLQHWNAAYNLTAHRDLDSMRLWHLVDCLAVVAPIEARMGVGAKALLDVGSGSGLPGVVLALSNPAWSVRCVDAVAKKTAFVRQVSAELGLPNLQAIHQRVEAVRAPPLHDLIVARAFASLADLVALTRHLITPGGWWMAMKGKTPVDELAALPADVTAHVEPLVVEGLPASRCLVWMQLR